MTLAERTARRIVGLTRQRTRRGALWRVRVPELLALLGCGERTLWTALALAERLVVRSRVWCHRDGCWICLLGRGLPLGTTANGKPRHATRRGRPAADAARGAAAAAAAPPAPVADTPGQCTADYRGDPTGSMVPPAAAVVPLRGGLVSMVSPAGDSRKAAPAMVWAVTRRICYQLPPLEGNISLVAHWLTKHGVSPRVQSALRRGALRAVADASDAAAALDSRRTRTYEGADWLRALAHAERLLGLRGPAASYKPRRPDNTPRTARTARAAEQAWRPAPLEALPYKPAPGAFRAALTGGAV